MTIVEGTTSVRETTPWRTTPCGKHSVAGPLPCREHCVRESRRGGTTSVHGPLRAGITPWRDHFRAGSTACGNHSVAGPLPCREHCVREPTPWRDHFRAGTTPCGDHFVAGHCV